MNCPYNLNWATEMLGRYIAAYDANPTISYIRLSRDEVSRLLKAVATPAAAVVLTDGDILEALRDEIVIRGEDEQEAIRAVRAILAIVGTPSKEGAGQVEAELNNDGVAHWLGDGSPRGESRVGIPCREAGSIPAAITPPASPSEGGGEQIAHLKQAIYTISGGDFDATDDEARRIAEAVRGFSPSRGERKAHCGNDACNWKGPISECCYLGSIGPCCPECREICEPEPRGEAVDAARLDAIRKSLMWDGDGYWLPDLCIKERQAGESFCATPTVEEFNAAIDAAFPPIQSQGAKP